MDARQFEKFMQHLIQSTEFSSGDSDSQNKVYKKVLEKIAKQEEELTDDDLTMAAGGLNNYEEKNDDFI